MSEQTSHASKPKGRNRGTATLGPGYEGQAPKFSLQMRPEDLAELNAQAQDAGVKRATLARQLILDGLKERGRELARASRAAQGLPPTVEDPVGLAAVATVIAAIPSKRASVF